MTRFRTLTTVAFALALSAPAVAQTTLNSTTTTAAVNATQQIIPLTATTSIAAPGVNTGGDYLFMDREVMQVNALDTVALTATVRRGVAGTQAAGHVSGVVVWTGPPRRFYLSQVVGRCTATSEEFLPHIVLPGPQNTVGGDIYQCQNGEWVQWSNDGYRNFPPGRTDGGTTYTAGGAITVQPGISFIGTAGPLAMTLVNPTVQQNGMIMHIIASTAQAHTVTYTAGFGGGTTARDVATFGGAINDELVIIAFNAVWWVVSTRNVTLA